MSMKKYLLGLAGAALFATAAVAGYWTAGTQALTGNVAFTPADSTSPSAVSNGAQPMSGYMAEYWSVQSVTGTASLTTGMNTVTACAGSLQEDAALTGLWVTFSIPTQTGSNAGKVTVKVWKPTASGDTTPIAATAAKSVGVRCTGT